MDVIIKGLTPEQAKEFAVWLHHRAENDYSIWFDARNLESPKVLSYGLELNRDGGTVVVQMKNRSDDYFDVHPSQR